MNDDVTVSPASASDVDAIAALLRAANLPAGDFQEHLAYFVVARARGGEVVGAVGAEVHGTGALLRSFVVAPAHRDRGLGRRLLNSLGTHAEKWGVARWWLLTNSAEKYFASRGFEIVDRTTAPMSIQRTREFRELCPSTATCLSRNSPTP